MTGLTVGVVGLGALGEAVARRLTRSGFPLLVFDIQSGPLRYFVMKNDADIALSPRMLAETCNVAITVLPSAAAARDAVFGPEGLALGLRPGSVLVELGNSAFADNAAQVAELAARGVAVLEAPARGTPVDAKTGRLSIPVAGDPEAADRVMPVLRALSDKVTVTGPIGSGAIMASLAGAMRAAATLAAAEMLVVAERQGLDAASVLDFCATQGVLGAAIVEALRPRETPRSIAASHPIHAILDDLEAALKVAGAGGLSLRQAELCREIWTTLQNDRGPDDDHANILRWLQERAAAKPSEKEANAQASEEPPNRRRPIAS